MKETTDLNFCFELLENTKSEKRRVQVTTSVTPAGSYFVSLAKMHMQFYLMVIKSFKQCFLCIKVNVLHLPAGGTRFYTLQQVD